MGVCLLIGLNFPGKMIKFNIRFSLLSTNVKLSVFKRTLIIIQYLALVDTNVRFSQPWGRY